MFNDTTGKMATTTYSKAVFKSTKRKIVQYVAYVDSSDGGEGHGTHVSGTVAGYCTDSSKNTYNGRPSHGPERPRTPILEPQPAPPPSWVVKQPLTVATWTLNVHGTLM